MGSVTEYRYEQFIDQYEHIIKLELLTSEELSQLKRKRNHHETLIKNSTEVKVFIDYIQYEVALMKKFRQMDYADERDGSALDLALAKHIKELFRLSLKRFKEKRKLWEMYINFMKQKFRIQVTRIYEKMLHYHRKVSDFAEAAEHEMSMENYQNSMNFLMQGIAVNKKDNEKLVLLYIECCAKSAGKDSVGVEAAMIHTMKSYEKFLKPINDVSIHCELLKRIQHEEHSKDFQNYVLQHLKENFSGKSELWNLLATRHIEGLFEDEEEKIPQQICIKRGLETYERALESVDEDEKMKMYEFCIEKILELEEENSPSDETRKILRKSLGKSLTQGFEENKLSSQHFLILLQLRMNDMKKFENDIEEMLEKGQKLYQNSMEFFELAIKYFFLKKDFENVKKIFNIALLNNKKESIELYRFLCKIYLARSQDKDKARQAMLEAINSSNKELSEAFQPFYIEYLALTDGIEKAKETFHQLLTTKPLNTLSLDFFKIMIKLEEEQENPDSKLIKNCYERATEHFGRENVDIWINFVEFLWKSNKHREADDLRKRALIYLKKDTANLEDFEKKFIQLRTSSGM